MAPSSTSGTTAEHLSNAKAFVDTLVGADSTTFDNRALHGCVPGLQDGAQVFCAPDLLRQPEAPTPQAGE